MRAGRGPAEARPGLPPSAVGGQLDWPLPEGVRAAEGAVELPPYTDRRLRHRRRSFAIAAAAIFLVANGAAAQAAPTGPQVGAPEAGQPISEPSADPLFLGWETEPAMPSAGRVVASLQSGLAAALTAIPAFGAHPGAAPAWEFPLAAVLLLVQHEVAGHGGRGRELGLGPDYGFGFDLSAYTTLDEAPATNADSAILAAGGAEADGVMARRILLDALRPEGVDGARLPLMLMAKLDLSMYVYGTTGPDDRDEDFADQYREGNDVAFYLVARQAQRRGGAAGDLWEGLYEPRLDDPLLAANWDDVRATAVWNVLDPALVSAVFAYFRGHVLAGEPRVVLPVLPLGERWGVTAGTRGAFGPREVTRFLDLYLVPRGEGGGAGVWSVYVRDLDSSTDRTWGAGGGVHALPLGPRLAAAAQVDLWDEPDAAEGPPAEGTGWHAVAELEVQAGAHLGLAARAGAKSAGFFPGAPLGDGAYGGLGVTWRW